MVNHVNDFVFFQTKKIKLETLSEYLQAVRTQLKLSLAEVSKSTGVAVKMLQDLEAGAFARLPSGVYVKGFLEKLSRIYGLDKDLLIRQYEIERQIYKNINSGHERQRKGTGFFNRLIITPKGLSLIGGAVFVCLTVIYIVWQIISIAKVPFLEIESPKDLVVTEKSFVEIIGRTDAGAMISVNNEPVFVDDNGNFKTSLSLSAGSKELVVVAKNRFNKTVSKTLTIIRQVQTAADRQSVVLELEFNGSVEIGYIIDGEAEIKENFDAGGEKRLTGAKQILLSASNAGRVKGTINGQALGVLGREGEKIERIPFSAEFGNINSK